MANRYFEVTAETKGRLGFYSDLPPNPLEALVVAWYKKEGERISGIEDSDSGSVRGELVVRVGTELKDEVDIEAIGWEIGATLVKILVPEGEPFVLDLGRAPLRLAELEVGDGSDEESHAEEDHSHEPSLPSRGRSPLRRGKGPQEERHVRVTPLAQRSAEALGVRIEEVLEGLDEDIAELTHTHVTQFVEAHPSAGQSPASGHLGSEESLDLKNSKSRVKAAPKTRRAARELGVDLSSVAPSGLGGIVRLADVRARLPDGQAAAKKEEQLFEHEGSSEPERHRAPEITQSESDIAFEVLIPSVRRWATARHMTDAWRAPHASTGVDIDALPLILLREKMKEPFAQLHGVKLRFDHFFIAACAHLLSRNTLRILNAYWHEEDKKAEVRLYRHVNIGIACAIPPDKTRSGFSELVVPSVKRAETLTFLGIVRESERLIAEALSGNPKREDLSGLTFIVNNTGSPVKLASGKVVSGDEFPDPIFAAHTSAILAFGGVREEGMGRKPMRAVLRFDHRICDGYEPKLFLRELQELIEHPERILVLH